MKIGTESATEWQGYMDGAVESVSEKIIITFYDKRVNYKLYL
jgi:hypothetical protein